VEGLKSPPPPSPSVVVLKTPAAWVIEIVIFSVIKLSLLFSLYDRGSPVKEGTCLNCHKSHKILKSLIVVIVVVIVYIYRGRNLMTFEIIMTIFYFSLYYR